MFIFTLLLIPELIIGVRDGVKEPNQQDKTSTYVCHFSKAVSSSLYLFLVFFFFPREL